MSDQQQLQKQKITPYLWFDDEAEQAVDLYTSVFKRSKILSVKRYGAAGPGPAGGVMLISFELDGQEFVALNGGPVFQFTEAISLLVSCETQQEVDHFWERLSEGGETNQCGWLKDKFGVSWQIVPSVFMTMMQSPDATRSERVMQAMLGMTKFDIAALQRAYDGA